MLSNPWSLVGTKSPRPPRPLAPEQITASGRDKLESRVFCETHLQIPVGEMIFHVFSLAHNKKYPGWAFSNDRHSYHELVYTVRGSGHYELGPRTYSCKQGDIFLCPRNKIHHGAIDPGCTSWDSLVIGFDFSFARDPESYLDDLTVFPAVLPFHRHFFVDQKVFLEVAHELRVPIELVVERLEIELKNQNFDYDVVLRSQLLELLSLICRAARSQMPHTPLRQYASQAKALLRLERARQYMVENMCESVRLEEAARRACMSQYHFARQFKSAFGQTPMQYLTNLRMNEAKRLLISTDMSVTEIGRQLGFSSSEHFSRRFKEKVGLPPSEYAGNLAERMDSSRVISRELSAKGTPPAAAPQE